MLNVLAIVGYSSILASTLCSLLSKTRLSSADIFAITMFIVGLVAIIGYYIRAHVLKLNESNDILQKRLRVTAHSLFLGFSLVVLSNVTSAKFKYFDTFYLLGHLALLVSVMLGMNTTFGIAMLALYSVFFLVQPITASIPEMLAFVGRLVLLIFFMATLSKAIFVK
jgi:hypothetical protein